MASKPTNGNYVCKCFGRLRNMSRFRDVLLKTICFYNGLFLNNLH